MKLTVLGGAAAGGNSGQGCSGYLVQSENTNLVLDLGPGTLLEMRNHIDFHQLDAIVISHLHLDHVLDLLALRFLLAYNPLPRSDRLPLWLPPGGLGFLDRVSIPFAHTGSAAEFFPSVFESREYDPAAFITIGDYDLSFQPTIHYVPCWAIRVQDRSSGQALLYTADTGPAADLTNLGRDAQVVVAEATLLELPDEPFETRGHMTAGEAGELATAIGARTLVLTHLWEELGKDVYRGQAATTFADRLVIAEPGTRVEWQ